MFKTLMNGYTEEKILNLCNPKHIHSGFSKWYYIQAEIYSFGKYIREYGFYPQFLPLHIYTDHGGGAVEIEPYRHELETKAYAMFYHVPERVKRWKELSGKPCYTLFSPFVFYRRKNKITQSKEAKGTIAFPAHSTPDIKDVSHIENYIFQLKELPEEFQPVSVCIHFCDIEKGLHKVFIDSGFPVYTAGHPSDYRFTKRFYGILKNFKYSTSNLIGSYMPYSVEMGIPFSLYGQEPEFINISDSSIKEGKLDLSEDYSEYDRLSSLFEGLYTEITREQKELVEHNLGLHEGISRFEMTKALYTAYLKHGNLFEDLKYTIARYSKKPRWLFKQFQAEIFDF